MSSAHSKPGTSSRRLHLLPRDALIKTNPVDEAEWNFRPLLGFIQRRRFQLVVDLLGNQRFGRLLEIGYGSGIFLTELTRYCDELYGIDPHPMNDQVAQTLRAHGVSASLFSGDAASMPFADDFFNCVVAVSAVEFIADLAAACVEINRVLAPNGSVIVVTPGYSAIVDFGLKILTGNSAKDDFGDRRRAVVPTLLKHFTGEQRRVFPPLGGSNGYLYTALRLRKRR